MQRYLHFSSLAFSLLINLSYINRAIAVSSPKIDLSEITETLSQPVNKTQSTQPTESSIVAQTINPQPSEVIVPLPQDLDAPQINKPVQPSEPKPPEPQKPTIADPALSKKILDAIILNAIGNSSSRYPWLVNPASNLLESTSTFTPAKTENYSDVDIQYRGDQVVVRNLDYAKFLQPQQFYWVLPRNRIAIETRGWQAGIDYQGRETNTEINQRVKLTQALWGLQAVWSLPQPFRELFGNAESSKFTIQTISGEVTNPAGIPASPVVINNSNISTSAVRLAPPPPRLGTGSSNNPNGGGSLFQSLDAENAPLIIQAFPTNNIQALAEAEGLFVGARVPQSALDGAGIGWKDPFTGEGKSTAPPISSLPGIKIGQLGKFDNLDLLNLLVNPSLSSTERTLHYLNSLFWIPLGQRTPQVLRSTTTTEESYWQRFSFNQPHNRTLLQYDAVRAQATYSNVFANPGISVSFSFKEGEVNDLQSLNASLGLLLGGLFSLIRPAELTQSLEESRDRYDRREGFSAINTKATADQRRLINHRLNRGLYFANRTSGLQETSGTITFPSTITLDRAELFQIRTGNQRRLARFIQVERTWTDGQTYFSRLRLSNKDFGRLSFIGMPIPAESTALTPNQSSALQVLIEDPDGQQIVQDFAATDSTVVPISIRSSDLAFDRIELTQIGRAKTQINRFEGYLYLPAVEALWSGSSGKWNYSVNSGVWLNLNGDSAFDVSRNNIGDPEPSAGFYLNALLNHIEGRIQRGADGKPKSIINSVPSIRFAWSSAANPSNPAYVNVSYTYSRQQKELNYSITPGFLLTYDNDRLEAVSFFQGQFGLQNGLEFRSSLELNSDFFYTFETLQRLSPIWSIGLYVQNYRSSDSLIDRQSDLSYGISLNNRSPSRGFSWRSRFGMSGDQFEIRLQGGYQF